jgi:hypothetical protein
MKFDFFRISTTAFILWFILYFSFFYLYRFYIGGLSNADCASGIRCQISFILFISQCFTGFNNSVRDLLFGQVYLFTDRWFTHYSILTIDNIFLSCLTSFVLLFFIYKSANFIVLELKKYIKYLFILCGESYLFYKTIIT